MSPAAGHTLTFDQATVDLDPLERAAYAVAAVMTVDIRADGGNFVCTLFPRRPDAADPDGARDAGEELRHMFRAEVNDQILRARIAAQTEPLRNLVFAVAFSRTGLTEAEPGSVHGNDAVQENDGVHGSDA
jgi:His-Xaa-Ser system protein HxsD